MTQVIKEEGDEDIDEIVDENINCETNTEEETPNIYISELGLPALCFPSFFLTRNAPDQNTAASSLWEKACEEGPHSIVLVYRIPDKIPSGLLHRAIIRLNLPEYFKFYLISHWTTGALFWNQDHQLIFRLFSKIHPDGDELILFEFKALKKRNPHNKNTECSDTTNQLYDQKKTQSGLTKSSSRRKPRIGRPKCGNSKSHWSIDCGVLWKIILQLLEEFDRLLEEYRGIWYRRVAQCTQCKELTFPGEWLTPQEVQAINYRKCQVCGFKVASEMLAPPRDIQNNADLEHMRKMFRKR